METEETKPDVSTEEAVTPTESVSADTDTTAGEAVVAPKYKGFAGKLDKFFGISKAKSSFTTEIFAGLTTFLAMCYILTVNLRRSYRIRALRACGRRFSWLRRSARS